jgi:hypothetical protein
MITDIRMRTVIQKMMMIEIDIVMIVIKEDIRGMITKDTLIQTRGAAEKIQTEEAKVHRIVAQEIFVMGEK